MNSAVPFIQDVPGVYTPPFLDTDELNMALRARKVSKAFGGEAGPWWWTESSDPDFI